MTRNISLNDLMSQYVKEKSLSAATIKTYEGVINRFAIDTKAHYLSDISFDSALEWRSEILRRASDTTWNNYLRHMRALWRFAINKKYVGKTDFFGSLNWGNPKKKKTKTLTHQQLESLMQFISAPNCQLQPVWFWAFTVRFLYFTGIRRRQLVYLKWQDIDLDSLQIQLSANSSKTGSEYSIPIPAPLLPDLIKYRIKAIKESSSNQTASSQAFNVTLYNKKYIGEQMTVGQVTGFFGRLSNLLGFSISAHMLRHTMATEIAKSGKIKPLQLILGHSDVRTTLVSYVHPDMDELRNAMCGLREI